MIEECAEQGVREEHDYELFVLNVQKVLIEDFDDSCWKLAKIYLQLWLTNGPNVVHKGVQDTSSIIHGICPTILPVAFQWP